MMKYVLFVPLLLACVLCARPGSAAEPMRVACMAYTFSKHDGPFLEALEKTAKVGARFIEISPGQPLSRTDPTKMQGLSDVQIALALAEAEKLGVKPISIYLTILPDEAGARASFEYAKKLGVKNITTESFNAITFIEKLVPEYDLTISFHTHARKPADPRYWSWNPDYVFGFLQGRDPRIGVCAETGHWATSGVVSLNAIKLLAGRIHSLHLKDRSALGRATPDQVYGTGVNRIGDILIELKRQGGSPIITVEYESNTDNNLEEVAECIAFVRTQLGQGAVR
ncbi:MAG: sugar phosphate isomerase/epimerase [Opitutus sp.]|nr:sugar phosphate isomerase/epimerase [Opitutus sp.]